jgi:ParB/RepB/Spo0J family partition protein
MLDNKLHTVDPTTIIIDDAQPRQRKDIGEINKLIASIQTYGQIQPIVVTRDMVLIAGGRRLAACLAGGFQAKICYADEMDPLTLKELELEENIQRKALTPAEECFAIDSLVQLKQKKYGKPTQGRTGGYTLENAAEAIGKTKGNVIEAIQMADMLRQFPDLSQGKTKSEIKRSYKGLQRIQQNITALTDFKTKLKDEKRFNLVNMPAETHLPSMKTNSINLLFTDPPYGIDIDKNAMTTGGKTGGNLTNTGITYEDNLAYATKLLTTLAEESYRITKESGHAYIFCGRDRFIFALLYDLMLKAKWDVLKWPIVWVKGNSGQNNQPDRWPSSAYEAILFARKPSSKVILQGKPDWIQCDIVPHGQKTHQAEKPVTLCKELINRVALPGDTLYDPFAGSGAIIQAACEMKLIATGCEKGIESFATALARLNKWKEGEEND